MIPIHNITAKVQIWTFYAVSVGVLYQKTITEGSRHTPASPPRLRNVGYGRAVPLAEL
jgi:hypothetical protein